MYNTSAAYKAAISNKLQQSRLVITVQPKTGAAFTIADDKLLPKSVSYTNKASKNNDFSYGSVYVGQFSFTVLNVDESIDRYALYDAKITPVLYQKISVNQEEAIPIGEFYVSEPKWNKKTIVVKCYDAMTNFDVPQNVDTFGTPFELLELLCNACGVTLGMTQGQIEAMPNGSIQLTMSAARTKTCRDALSYISTVLCGFATINRAGELEIRSFGDTSVSTIGAARRISSTIADYETYFLGIKARFLQAGNWVKVSANVPNRTSGLVLDLGDVPVVQGVTETLQQVAQRIANQIGLVYFTPSDVVITSDASLDLGDLVTYTGVNNTEDTIVTPITSLVWKYHGEHRLKGEGGNTKLNAVTDYQTKQIATVETDAAVNEYAMKFYTNAESYSIGNTDVIIILMNYSVYKDTVSEFICTIPITTTLDGNLVFTIAVGNDDVCSFTQYVDRGTHAITLSTYITNASNSQNRLTVRCRAEYFESDKRKNDAKIAGLILYTSSGTYEEQSIDETVLSGFIQNQSIKAVLFASGINVTESWDGTLLVVDRVGDIDIPATPAITVSQIYENTNINTQENTIEDFVEHIGIISFVLPTFTVDGINESVIVGRKSKELVIEPARAVEYTFNSTYVNVTETAFALRTDYDFVGVVGTIDSGYMTSVEIPLGAFDTVTEVIVE